jgi:hypothetical protein
MRVAIELQEKRRGQHGLTLLEILVSVSILVIIVFGLMAMFNQTQKAFRSGLTNTDVLGAGRAATEIISRDLEQAIPADLTNNINFYLRTNVVGNLLLPIGGQTNRKAVLEQVYFLSRPAEWSGTGYQVLDPNNPSSTLNLLVGTLYRYSTNSPQLVLNGFLNTFLMIQPDILLTNRALSPIIDGVVHFNLQYYDSKGREYSVVNGNLNTNTLVGRIYAGDFAFLQAEIPAYLELELGILEPATTTQLRAISDPTAAAAFLNKHQEKIHFFRQQIPIRTARR